MDSNTPTKKSRITASIMSCSNAGPVETADCGSIENKECNNSNGDVVQTSEYDQQQCQGTASGSAAISLVKSSSSFDSESSKSLTSDLSTLSHNVVVSASADALPSSTITTQSVKQAKSKCHYGSTCYRRNDQHKAEFLHPGDTEYMESDEDDENDIKPYCKYGANCYRQNPQHHLDFSHTHPATNLKDSRRGKKLRKRTSSKCKKKDCSDADESDDDIDEFLNDAVPPDNYEPASSDSDEIVTDDDQVENDSIKRRMLKEAKKFIES